MDNLTNKQLIVSSNSNQRVEDIIKGKGFLHRVLCERKNFGSYSRCLTVKEVVLSQLFDRFHELQNESDLQLHKKFLGMIFKIFGEKRGQAKKIIEEFFPESKGTNKEFGVKIQGIGLLLCWPTLDNVKLVDLAEGSKVLSAAEKRQGIVQLYQVQSQLFSLKCVVLSDGMKRLGDLLRMSVKNVRGSQKMNMFKEFFDGIQSNLRQISLAYGAQQPQVFKELGAPAGGGSQRSKFKKVGKFFEAYWSEEEKFTKKLISMDGVIENWRAGFFRQWCGLVDLLPAETKIPLPKSISQELQKDQKMSKSLDVFEKIINSFGESLRTLNKETHVVTNARKDQMDEALNNINTAMGQLIKPANQSTKPETQWSKEDIKKTFPCQLTEEYYLALGYDHSYISKLKNTLSTSYGILGEMAESIDLCSKVGKEFSDSLKALWKRHGQEVKLKNSK